MKMKHTYLALGDSYTIGESVEKSDSWPVQLAGLLNSEGKSFNPPRIIAKTGWTTSELLQAIALEHITETYDLVTLLIGVNNQYRGNDPEIYRVEFIKLLKKSIVFAGDKKEHVVVVSIPDWGVTPFAKGRDRDQIAKEVDLFNRIAREETEREGVLFVDITVDSKKAAFESSLTAGDGLHPSGAMYFDWAKSVFNKIKSQY